MLFTKINPSLYKNEKQDIKRRLDLILKECLKLEKDLIAIDEREKTQAIRKFISDIYLMNQGL